MGGQRNFWRNAAIIGLIHLMILIGLVKWGDHAQKPLTTSIQWINASALGSLSAETLPEIIPEIIMQEIIIPEVTGVLNQEIPMLRHEATDPVEDQIVDLVEIRIKEMRITGVMEIILLLSNKVSGLGSFKNI